MTWNIEGFQRNKTNLHTISKHFKPDFIFLSEANMFQYDLNQNMRIFLADYSSSLNSPDLYDQDLPLIKSRTVGGTMILWRRELD